jgi:predicted transcriptional regulator
MSVALARDIRESVYLNEAESRRLDDLAREIGVSRSALLRCAFLELVRRRESDDEARLRASGLLG